MKITGRVLHVKIPPIIEPNTPIMNEIRSGRCTKEAFRECVDTLCELLVLGRLFELPMSDSANDA